MPLPDNRMRFPSPTIDFDTEVGTTGQDHDNYPSPNSQARFDWMRLAIIALLANQSSTDAPTNYREGTIWFDLTTSMLKIWMGGTTDGDWQPLSKVINVTDDSTIPVNLHEFYQQFKLLEARVSTLESRV